MIELIPIHNSQIQDYVTLPPSHLHNVAFQPHTVILTIRLRSKQGCPSLSLAVRVTHAAILRIANTQQPPSSLSTSALPSPALATPLLSRGKEEKKEHL